MTAEERMAYFQGTKRRNDAYPVKTTAKSRELIFLKIRFFFAVLLFILFLSMDYTGYRFCGIGSEEIITEVTKDMELQLPKPEEFAL